jgi:hypothetical protein
VFGEVYRVLTAGGRFLIWDAIFPRRAEEEKDVAVFSLTVRLGKGEVGCGIRDVVAGRGARSVILRGIGKEHRVRSRDAEGRGAATFFNGKEAVGAGRRALPTLSLACPESCRLPTDRRPVVVTARVRPVRSKPQGRGMSGKGKAMSQA